MRVRCANPRCRNVCDDKEWVLKPKEKPTEVDIRLGVRVAHCPKCDCKSYYRVKPCNSDERQGGAE